LERAIAIRARTVGTDHTDYAAALTNLGTVYQDEGNLSKARELYAQALRIDEKRLGAAHPRVENDLNNLGTTAFRAHDNAAAESWFRQALDRHAQRGAPE